MVIQICIYIYILVGGRPTPLKKYESQLGLLFPTYGKTCSKPPTSIYITKKLLVGSGISMSFPADSHLKGWIPFGEGAGLSLSDIVPHAKGTCLVD